MKCTLQVTVSPPELRRRHDRVAKLLRDRVACAVGILKTWPRSITAPKKPDQVRGSLARVLGQTWM